MSTKAIIDAATYADLRASTGDAFLSELVDAFCEEVPKLIAELQRALAVGDAVTFGRQAHSIKSNSATFGALAYAALARELEALGRTGDLSSATQGVERLVADYPLVEGALRAMQHAA